MSVSRRSTRRSVQMEHCHCLISSRDSMDSAFCKCGTERYSPPLRRNRMYSTSFLMIPPGDKAAVEARAVSFGFGGAVGNLVPEDRLQTIQARLPGTHLYVGMERNQVMPPALLSRNTDIADHATNAATAHQYPPALPPHFVELHQEVLVVLEMSHLCRVAWRVFLQSPIGWRGHYEVNAGVWYPRKVPRIAQMNPMLGATEWLGPRHPAYFDWQPAALAALPACCLRG